MNGLAGAAWLSRSRSTPNYDLIMRVGGSTWFLLLAGITFAGVDLASWSRTLSGVPLGIFYLILWFLIATRPAPGSQCRGLLPRLAAFVGTYLPWTFVFVTPGSNDTALNLASVVCILVGTFSMLVTIGYLGRSFSLVPQARSLVTTGPYRWVRNPLYLAEEVAVFGNLLQHLSPATAVILVAHFLVQIYRILCEEELLFQTFPDYRAYAESLTRKCLLRLETV